MTTTTAAGTSAVPQPRPAAGSGAPTAAVRAIGLRKTYGHGDNAVHALDGVDVDFHAGRFTAVMGPSGSGKSTLMHVTAGLDTATAGQVLLGDTDLTTLKDKALTALRRDRLGFVFQQFNLIPTLTALENITLPLALAGRRADREWLDRIVQVVGLESRLAHRPAELSGGQQQRVAVARALVGRPEVVYADEPTGNLDSRSGAEVLSFLRRSVEDMGQTIVMVTHDAVAASYADRVVFLADGQVVGDIVAPTSAAGAGLHEGAGPMRRYALRGILAHKRRLLSTVTAVLLGVAFMAGSLVFTDTMKASLSGAFQDGERSTDVLVRGPVTIKTGQGDQHAPVPARLAADLAGVDGVAAVAPRLEGFAQVLGADGKPVDDLSGGAAPSGAAWAADERLNPFELVDGRAPRGADEVVVDRSTADAADLAVGDRTSVLTGAAPQDMTVVGIATFAGQDNRAGNRTVLFSAATANRLLGGDGRVDGIALLADDGVDQAQLAKRVEAVLPAGDEAITGTALAEENGKRTNEDVTFFSLFMTVFAVVALLVGAFIISNTFTILVAQRTRELALLRAIGASARQVRRSVVLEALVVGTVASALGLLAGVGVARGIQELWSVLGITMPDGPLVVSGRSLVIAFVVGVLVTVASALLPARRAARVAPVAAMRAVAVEPVRVSRRRAAIGLVLTAASGVSVVLGILGGVVPLVLLGALGALFGVATLAPLLARPVVRLLAALLPRLVGIRGLLARENAVRNPRRTAATASALMIGVALVGSITSFAASGKHSVTASFDQEFRGDLVVESGAWMFGGVSPELSTALQARPEVAVAVPRQFTQAQVGDGSAEVTGWTAGLAKVFDVGRTPSSAATLGADGVALGTSYAKDHEPGSGRLRDDHDGVRREPQLDRAPAVPAHRLGRRGGGRPGHVRCAAARRAGHQRLHQGRGRRECRGTARGRRPGGGAVRERPGARPGRDAGRRRGGLQRGPGHRLRPARAGDRDRAARHREHGGAVGRGADP